MFVTYDRSVIFKWVLLFPPATKSDCHDTTEILPKKENPCLHSNALATRSSSVLYFIIYHSGGHFGRDRMVVWFSTTCAISAYHHSSCEFEPRSWWGVLDTTLCDKVCQWLATGLWFSLVSSTNKTDRHDITEILLKVALNTINLYRYIQFLQK